nr:uncharacterized protein LOC108949012 [Nicotiana tomentosiformis]
MCAKESVHESLNETGHLAKRGMKDDDGKIGSTHLYENRPDQGPPKNVSEQQDIEQQPDSMEVEDGGQEKGGIKHAHDVPTDNNEPGPSVDQEENHGLDEPGSSIDEKMYKGMISSLLYLNANRPDIIFSVEIYASFQSHPKESHMKGVKRILRYFKGTQDLVLWYSSGCTFDLLGYPNGDYVGYLADRNRYI